MSWDIGDIADPDLIGRVYGKLTIKSLILVSAVLASSHAASNQDNFGENDFLKEPLQSRGWVKVRVWEEGAYLEGDESWEWGPGHVSLETADSYLSLWPTTKPPKGAKIWESPAGLVKHYATDYLREGKRPPTHVFLLYLKEMANGLGGASAIRAMKEHYIKYHKAQAQKNPHYVDVLTDSVMWYSKGGSSPVDSFLLGDSPPLYPEKQYFNCASFVAVALAVADPEFLEMYLARYPGPGKKSEMIKKCYDTYLADSTTVQQQGKIGAKLTELFAEIAAYFNDLFMPSDILKILQQREMHTYITRILTSPPEVFQVISSVPGAFPPENDELIKLYKGDQKEFWNKLGKLTFIQEGSLQLEITNKKVTQELKKFEKKSGWCPVM